jgi:hypothetical protein
VVVELRFFFRPIIRLIFHQPAGTITRFVSSRGG